MRIFGAYALVASANASANNSTNGIERKQSKFVPDRNNPPQFYLPGSLTPADVTKWGSGCWKHCWEGFSGRCKLCGSTACRIAPHEFECRQYKHCTLNVANVCKDGEDCDAVKIRWWQTCWTSPCTSQCWYKNSVGNEEQCNQCCKDACRRDEKYIGNSCFRCSLCKSRYGPHTWGKLSPEDKYNGHVCWGKDKTKGVIKHQLRFPLPESSQQVVSNIITMGQPAKPTHSQKPDQTDTGISQIVAGGFDTTNTKPSKLDLDENKDCEKICMNARRSTVKKEDAYVQARKWNECKQCLCWENPDMEMCEAVDCHISCWGSNFSGDRCLQCTRCNSCPGVGREKDTMSNAVESIFSRGEGTSEAAGNENKIMGERSNRNRRTLNSQFGYTHNVGKATTKFIKRLKMANVFDPHCKKCVRMGQQQSCRESCAAYKRNPQNHIAAKNCKMVKPPCAPKLAAGCKKCIRECFNIKTVALNALPSSGQDGSPKAVKLGETTFENCYHTFGCANDCDASLTKIKGALSAKAGREDGDEIAVGDLSPEEQIEWARDLPYESVKEAREMGIIQSGIYNLQAQSVSSRREPKWSPTQYKMNGWWGI